MLKRGDIQSLPALAGPVLTVYLDTDQAKQVNRGLKPGYLMRLESQAKLIAQTVSPDEQEFFRKQLQRIEAYLESRPPRCRGTAIFAGNDSWEFVPLQVEVEDEIHWGAPSLAQLLWLLDEHKRYGVVVPSRKRARFFLYWLGEVCELEEKEFRLEPSKRKEMGPVARLGVRVSRGTNRDVFEHHVAAEYAHYDQQIAERIERWFAAEQLESVFLVGLTEMVKAIRKEVAPTLVEKIVLIEEDLGWVSQTELLDRIEPAVVSHKRKCEMASVEAMLGDPRNVVLGVDEALAQLQQGKIRGVVVIKGLDGSLQQCMNCSWADRTSDPICPACGGKRENVALRDVLPELVRRYNASLEIVSGESARKLEERGGMGAWLREFEKKEYSASA
jgi:Bacterial archaeo-eukaryotic release factor family 10